MNYNFTEIEKNWQEYWATNKTFKTYNDSSKPKYYVLDMFPYPSGAGLHVGHPLGYIASDIMARYKRHKGFNVLHPMGYDSFGLPAEQYAIQTGQHPKITTQENIARYRQQMDKIGFSFDWDREVKTSDPEYYKWTQWIFIQLFNSWYNKKTNRAEKIETLITEFENNGNKNIDASCDNDVTIFSETDWANFSEKEKSDCLMQYRIAYLGEAYVNWCAALGTVLANDEVKDGVSERGGHPVERKLMKQWNMRITAYAERLLQGLDTIDWTDSLKESQKYWIGKSVGTSLEFKILPIAIGTKFKIVVFTTRPDTIFGVSFVTLAPEHELVDKITTDENKKAVEEYVIKSKNRSERERQADVNKISGVFTGAYVEHPFTKKQIPVWVGDYVLAGYGTGAVMAVPAHDERDFKFATHFGLPVPVVVQPTIGNSASPPMEGLGEAYEQKDGTLINSDFLNGLEVKDAIKKAIAEIEKQNLGKGKINFRLRDAVFGRQRYWGEPIPIYYKNGIPYALVESELPLVLPEVDKYLPTEDGEPPLARAKDWAYKPHSNSPQGGEDRTFPYETTTMPGWAGSSWYYLRYMDAKNKNEFASKDLINYWQQIDLYIGGSEHATGHLMYFRFWTKFLFDLGLIPFEEPAKKLINQGMIQGRSEKIYKLIPANPIVIDKTDIDSINTTSKTCFSFYWNNQMWNFEHIYREEIGDFQSTYISAELTEDFSLHEFLKIHGYKLMYTYSPFDASENIGNSEFSDLNIESFVQKEKNSGEKTDKRNARYICRHGYWQEGIFHSKYNESKESFKTRSTKDEKLSKSKLNVQTPDDICEKFGSDTLRLYEMFLGPLEQSKPWNTNGITGVHNFLKKLWRLFYSTSTTLSETASTELTSTTLSEEASTSLTSTTLSVTDNVPTKAELKSLHKTIKKITEDIERFSFNTSVSNFMICVKELSDLKCNKREILEPLLILISPYAPHICEELWKNLGHTQTISFEPFPICKEEYLVEDNFNYPISFNGKMKFNLQLSLSLSIPEIEKEVMSKEETLKFLNGASPKKIIIVPNKIVNIVV